MVNQTNDAINERGGIALRDYTQGGRYTRLSRRAGNLDGVRGTLQKFNFDKVARGLGWYSLGLGLMEILAPERVQKLVGVRGDHTGLIRLLGVRELMHAVLIFMQPRPAQGVWTRVAGDAIDMASLGAAYGLRRVNRDRLNMASAAVLGVTALDLLTATQLTRKRAEARRYSALTREALTSRTRGGAFHVTRSITINRSPEVLYRYWRSFENLPQFMYHLDEVRVMDDRRSYWVAKAPAGRQVAWEAEITDDRPNELIAWQSLPGADVPNSGLVRFEPGPAGRGTVVHVEIEYRPPGGAVGKAIAKLFGEEPGQQVAGDLRRFKQVMETGEVVRSEGSPKGFGQKRQRPAQPLPDTNGGRQQHQAPEWQREATQTPRI